MSGVRTTINFDIEKVDALIANKGITEKEFSESLGHTSGYYRHAKERGTLTTTDYLLIKSIYGIDVELKEKEEKIETTNDTIKDIVDVIREKNNDDVLKKLDEVLTTMNKLGNIQMQLLEELHKTNSHLLKANGRPIARI